jgi:hypothetical protein
MAGSDSSDSGQGQLLGCCEEGKDFSDSIKCGKLIE